MARKRRLSELTEEYQQVRSTYEAFAVKVEELIRALLEQKEIPHHSITSRAKDVKSFADKISREGKAYKAVSEVTDLAGIRIICYLSDDVDVIAKVIRDEFTVVEERSVDKRKTLDPDRFGYISLHYVAKLPDERVNWTEYQSYRDLLCEIQIRTILQHAWAEIEHDLGYKSSIGIPQRERKSSRQSSRTPKKESRPEHMVWLRRSSHS